MKQRTRIADRLGTLPKGSVPFFIFLKEKEA